MHTCPVFLRPRNLQQEEHEGLKTSSQFSPSPYWKKPANYIQGWNASGICGRPSSRGCGGRRIFSSINLDNQYIDFEGWFFWQQLIFKLLYLGSCQNTGTSSSSRKNWVQSFRSSDGFSTQSYVPTQEIEPPPPPAQGWLVGSIKMWLPLNLTQFLGWRISTIRASAGMLWELQSL